MSNANCIRSLGTTPTRLTARQILANKDQRKHMNVQPKPSKEREIYQTYCVVCQRAGVEPSTFAEWLKNSGTKTISDESFIA